MAIKHMKRCLTLLIFREGEISSPLRYHLTLVRMTSQKIHSNKFCRSCGEKKTLPLWVGMYMDTPTRENTTVL